MRRAAVSIPSNIAEGDELGTDKQAVRFLSFAKGSAAEVMTQSNIALDIGYINQTTFAEIEDRCVEILKMLSRLISARSSNKAPGAR